MTWDAPSSGSRGCQASTPPPVANFVTLPKYFSASHLSQFKDSFYDIRRRRLYSVADLELSDSYAYQTEEPSLRYALSTLDVLEQLLSDSLLLFAPVLLEVVRASTPPSLSYFKNLPTDVRKCWAIYLLVFEKAGCRPKIYVGSDTSGVWGTAKWFQDYDNQTTLPTYIRRALKDSYTILCKGLLCWSPIPAPSRRFPVRASFLAIEATLSIVLWATVPRTNDYGMPHFCPWSLETIEYDGCCSHSAFVEHIIDEAKNLTPQQTAAKEIEVEQRRVEQKKTKYYESKRLNFQEWHETRRRYSAAFGPVKKAAIAKKHSQYEGFSGVPMRFLQCCLHSVIRSEYTQHCEKAHP